MTSEKLRPDASGLPGPAVGICLTGSFPEDCLISIGLCGCQEGAKEAIQPFAHRHHMPTPKALPHLPHPSHTSQGGREVTAQARSGHGSKDCLLVA